MIKNLLVCFLIFSISIFGGVIDKYRGNSIEIINLGADKLYILNDSFAEKKFVGVIQTTDESIGYLLLRMYIHSEDSVSFSITSENIFFDVLFRGSINGLVHFNEGSILVPFRSYLAVAEYTYTNEDNQIFTNSIPTNYSYSDLIIDGVKTFEYDRMFSFDKKPQDVDIIIIQYPENEKLYYRIKIPKNVMKKLIDRCPTVNW